MMTMNKIINDNKSLRVMVGTMKRMVIAIRRRGEGGGRVGEGGEEGDEE